jgi:putative Holliday junction resolvase
MMEPFYTAEADTVPPEEGRMLRPEEGRVLGVDLGSRRIGVAVSDGLGLTAQPVATIARHGGLRDLEALALEARKYDVRGVVLGWPLTPEGERGDAARRAEAFAAKLRAHLALPVVLVDESFSTVEAEDVLIAADVSRARRKQVVDRLAAAVILQRWLDQNAAASRRDSESKPEEAP